MKLHQYALSPNSKRVRMFLAEKRIKVDFEEVDLAKAEHRSEAFLARNPLGRVPVLELDDGSNLVETVAICRYLEGEKPTPCLLGRDSREQAQVEMYQHALELYAFERIADAFRHTHPFFKELTTQVPEYGKVAADEAIATLRIIDGILDGRPHVAGDEFSIADITTFCALEFAPTAGVEIPAELRNLARWRDHVAKRPSATA